MTRIFADIVKQARVDALGVAMPGARLPERVRQIVDGGAVTRISRARMVLLAAACVVMCGAFLAGMPTRAHQDAGQTDGAAKSGERQKFEAASVKQCDADSLPPPVAGDRGGGSPPPQWSPGRLTIACQPVRFFIMQAYINHANAQTGQDGSPMSSGLRDMGDADNTIDGLPDWAKSIRYTIQAEVPGDASRDMMMGPMMQSLLEDRFRLKLHASDKNIPAYDLVVAKGGPKLPQNGKALCRGMLPPKADEPVLPVPEPGNGPRCTMQFNGVNMADLARLIEGPIGVGRPVIDKTGITGRYQIRMLWSVDRSQIGVPPPDSPPDQSNLPDIFEAVKEQVGLELVPSTGTAKALVIDHIEQPTPN